MRSSLDYREFQRNSPGSTFNPTTTFLVTSPATFAQYNPLPRDLCDYGVHSLPERNYRRKSGVKRSDSPSRENAQQGRICWRSSPGRAHQESRQISSGATFSTRPNRSRRRYVVAMGRRRSGSMCTGLSSCQGFGVREGDSLDVNTEGMPR